MKRYTSTSNALQQYYRGRHIKLNKAHANTSVLIDSQSNAMHARDFVQGFTRKHIKQSKKTFIAWLLK